MPQSSLYRMVGHMREQTPLFKFGSPTSSLVTKGYRNSCVASQLCKVFSVPWAAFRCSRVGDSGEGWRQYKTMYVLALDIDFL